MGFMDKVKSQATQLASAGQQKLDAVQAKRQSDAMLRDLGAAVFAQRTGRATPEDTDRIESLVTSLQQHEAAHGPIQLTPTAADVAASPDTGTTSGT